MKLSLAVPKVYRVKRGQTLFTIAKTFRLPPRALAGANGLTEEVKEGMLLKIPEGGNLYMVRGGENFSLLAGSAENFAKKNYTVCLYVGQVVLL